MCDKKNLRVVMAQLNLCVGDTEGNVAKIMAAIDRAKSDFTADIVLFPELTLTGYPPEDLLLRPGYLRNVAVALRQLATTVSGIDVVVGHPEQTNTGLYNSASYIREGKVIATYQKQCLPNYGVFDEVRYFLAGDATPLVEIKGVKVALSICEDLWHTEPMEKAVQSGAQLMLNLNASPYQVGKQIEREKTIQLRAKEVMPIVYVNLVGGQDELVFDGGSFVVDGTGRVMQRAASFVEGLYFAEFDVNSGVKPLPASCVEIGSEEKNIYNAIVLGLRDYVQKTGFSGVIIGLSGGVDSALTLALAVDALGQDQVEAVMMPFRYTSEISVLDARQEAENLGIKYSEISIETLYDTFMLSLADEFAGRTDDTTEENLQARIRGVLLMAMANKKNKLVLPTGNKSEMAVGYATLYGDMVGGFAPIKDVMKTMVYRLCRYRNNLSPVIPERVLTRPPSAELAPDQIDTDSLPPYDQLDMIVKLFIEEDADLDTIVAAGFAPDVVIKIINMMTRNEYKRRQAAPGVRITRRAFGRDRRYPITSKVNWKE
ncbi:MAG: NAD+ synthase [Gammaproteobacteria bacterium]|nr:NAD+ synthase [Gammaproteobacteria bacterium]